MKNIEKCPFCGSEEFVLGVQSSYAAISPMKVLSLKSQNLYHVICTECGSVVKSYVTDPKKLITKKIKCDKKN